MDHVTYCRENVIGRGSTSASEAEKQMASIVLNFFHQASAQAQEKLKRLAGFR
jgi:hypothetical protein